MRDNIESPLYSREVCVLALCYIMPLQKLTNNDQPHFSHIYLYQCMLSVMMTDVVPTHILNIYMYWFILHFNSFFSILNQFFLKFPKKISEIVNKFLGNLLSIIKSLLQM